MEEMQTPARIFVSYAKEDREYYTLLEKTASHLVHQGRITLWNPHDHIAAGTPVREEISRQLQEASLIFLLFSSHYLADEACYEQMQQAIQIGEQEPDRVWIILLSPCLWTEIWDAITNKQHFHFLPRGHRALSTWPLAERDEIAQNIASEIIDFVRRARQGGSATQGSVQQPAPAVQLPNPYRGLLSFRIEDAPFFCGREKLTDEILEKIKHMLHARSSMNKEQRLLAIIGASGAGKSSLLHAGVLPRLMRGELAGSEAWLILRTLTLYADNNPLDNLADVLCDHLPAQERRSVKDRLNESTSELGFIVNDILRHARRDHSIPSGTYVVLVIDQFEECLKQSTQEGRQQFIKLLVTAATRPEYPLLILMTCRANFYEQLMKHSDLFELVRAHEAMLDRPMTFREMAAAIERPLHHLNSSYGCKLQFEDGLVDQIIADFHADFPGQIDALPFLQFTLFELFVHRDQKSHLITNQAYKDIKDVHAALAKYAEKIYKPFQEQEQEVRKLFLKLVKISMDNDLNSVIGRLRVNYAHILPPDTPAFETERATMEKMIQAFVKGRLLTVDGRGEQRTLEISHEILLRTWPRLEMWIRKDEDALFQKNSATQDARNWQRHNQPAQDLFTGSRLKQLKKLSEQGFIGENDEPLYTFFRKSQARQRGKIAAYISLVFIMLLILTPLAYAALNHFETLHQIQVTNARESGSGSLSRALQDAKAGDTIVLEASRVGKTITLQSDLNFAANDDNVTLQDKGVTLTAPDGAQIHIFPGIIVTFENLLLQQSRPSSKLARGGVIFNQGILRLVGCHIDDNLSNYNGGALVNTSELELDGTEFSGDSSTGYGGAIYNDGGSVFIKNGSDIKDNRARGGGGIYSIGGAVTIEQSTLEGNTAGKPDGSRYFGGGLALRNARLTMAHSIVQGNTVYGDGGGISLLDSSANLNASTITKNNAAISSTPSSSASPSPAWGGGGIAVDSSTAKNPSSQASIVVPPSGTPAKISDVIRNNFIWPGYNKSKRITGPLADILGSHQNPGQGNFFSIAAQPGAVTVGYPPSTGRMPETLPNYVGNIDMNLFCQTNGYDQGEPTPDNLSLITCVKVGGEKSFSALEACKALYPQARSARSVTTRLYDYYDPSTWECYQNIQQLPAFSGGTSQMMNELSKFCQKSYRAGSRAQLDSPGSSTAYSWQCKDAAGNLTGLSMADACRTVAGPGHSNAFERLADFNQPTGWECWEPIM